MIFERIDNEHQRAKVYGGWIVKAFDEVMTPMYPGDPPKDGYEWRISMCFVPDPNHDWILECGY